MRFLQTILQYLGFTDRYDNSNLRFKLLPVVLRTEILNTRNYYHSRKDLDKLYDDLSEHKESLSYYDFAFSLLKDGGVKRQIIKKYLPLINQQVNRYLRMMDFYINFKLDEEFTETIQSPVHDKFSYSSFSEGKR